VPQKDVDTQLEPTTNEFPAQQSPYVLQSQPFPQPVEGGVKATWQPHSERKQSSIHSDKK